MSMITQRTPTTTTTLGAAAGAVSAEDAPAPDECRIVIAEVFEETAFYAMDDEIHDVNMAEAADTTTVLDEIEDLWEACCCAGDDVNMTEARNSSKANFKALEQTVLSRALARSNESVCSSPGYGRQSKRAAAPAHDAPAAKRTKKPVVAKAKTAADIAYRPSFASQNVTDREAIFRAGIDKVDEARRRRGARWLVVRKTRIDVRNCFAPVCEAKKLVAMAKARTGGRFKKKAAWSRTFSTRI